VKLFAVAGKELTLYFTSLLFYVLATVFLVLAGWLFYTNLDFYVRFGGMNLVLGLWQYQFYDMRQLLLVFVPLLTMRLFAEERRLGTLELLWTYPLRDVEIVAGKYLACLVVLVAIIVPTLAYPLLLDRFQPISWGPLLAGYLGLALLAGAFSACGLFLSALTDSQLVAGASTYGVLLFFWIITWNEAAVSEGALTILRQLSLFDRFQVFMRGGIDTRDVSYLVLFGLGFLSLTLLALDSRRWRGLR